MSSVLCGQFCSINSLKSSLFLHTFFSFTPTLSHHYFPRFYINVKALLTYTFSILQGKSWTSNFNTHSDNRGHEKLSVVPSDQHYVTIYQIANADLSHSNLSYHQQAYLITSTWLFINCTMISQAHTHLSISFSYIGIFILFSSIAAMWLTQLCAHRPFCLTPQ